MPFPHWYAGQVITADRLSARDMLLVTQQNDLTLTTTSAVKSEIRFTPEPNAVYAYWCYISYSADTDTDLFWEWDDNATTGVLMVSFTRALNLATGAGVDTGSSVIMRRPGNTTDRVAGGSGIANFHSAYDSGTFITTGTPTEHAMYAGRNGVGTGGTTILRGGNQTRLLYQRIA